MESKINLSQVKPVNYRVTAALVNQFIVSTTQFLNRFGTRCDLKLRQVEHNMHRITTTLNILEAKLASIPSTGEGKPAQGGVANAVAAPAQPQQQQPPQQQVHAPDGQAQPHASPAQPSTEQPAANQEPQPPPEPVVQGPKLKDDPRYSTYFRMLKMGVPAQGVKNKMQAEGADPSVLDMDPEGPAPPGAPPPPASDDGDTEEESEDEFSD